MSSEFDRAAWAVDEAEYKNVYGEPIHPSPRKFVAVAMRDVAGYGYWEQLDLVSMADVDELIEHIKAEARKAFGP